MPALPGDSKSTVVSSVKELSDVSMMELTDSEVVAVTQEILKIQEKYRYKYATKANLDSMADEITTKMYNMGVLVTFDPTPLLEGDAPHLEILGKIGGEFQEHGFDHEREQWEVQRANDQGQDVYGKDKLSG
jgi:hypothetical protein